ncbi:hypothetical protein OOU_Y34scaffold00247g3 [Pyricularia oryzae Y34]|uniref:BRCT domain-containing protein n=1 Tax=Pyricularia oryzae (strain Y34) TaxID=1143189 RepID=A0AA97PP87_PYRO3|nr:hypothetical protein OOU_Y34scaffold00247g3 [Pyricularia oryzae Y34]
MSKPARTKKMEPWEKPVFRGCKIAIAGQLDENWTEPQIERWIKYRHGQLVDKVDDTVTHLVCSKEEFDKGGTGIFGRVADAYRIMKAKNKGKRGSKNLHKIFIVKSDWLEFSCLKAKKLRELDYEWNRPEKKESQKAVQEKRLAKGKQLEEDGFVNTELNHVYTDSTSFKYEITLEGKDSSCYTLYLFESNATPRLYHFVAKFIKKKRSPPNYHRPSATQGLFPREFDLLKAFFRSKTGVEWEDRLRDYLVPKDAKFTYTPPVERNVHGIDLSE